jgi:hypothetical protein
VDESHFAHTQSLNEPVPSSVGVDTPIDQGLQKFADWVKAYYADRPVLEVELFCEAAFSRGRRLKRSHRWACQDGV